MKSNSRFRVPVLVRGLSLLLAVLSTGVMGCASKPDQGAVARQWAANMSELSISPIFPPRENFFIGDVYLTYSVGNLNKYPADAANRPAIWLDSMPIDSVAYYNNRPSFASSQVTYTSMPDGSQLWQQPNEVIQSPDATNSARLRLVAFPAFNFASVTSTSLGLNVPGSTLGALLGFSSSDNLTISLSIPAAESYSIPATLALSAFVDRCKSNTEFDFAYSVAAKTLYDSEPEPQGFQPVVIVVNEVFYARAIDFTYTSKSGAGGTLSATLGSMVNLSGQISAVEQQLKTLNSGSSPAATPSSTTTGAPSAASVAATQTQVISLSDQLSQLQSQLNQAASAAVPSAPGATASVVSASATSITMRETFNRPVAIGYRALDLREIANSGRCIFEGISLPTNVGGPPIPIVSKQ